MRTTLGKTASASVVTPEMLSSIIANATVQALASLGFTTPAQNPNVTKVAVEAPKAAKPKLSAAEAKIQMNNVRIAQIKAELDKPKAKPVPEWIVRRAQNREANVLLAKACYEAGWTWNQTHDVEMWAKAREALVRATSREHLVTELFALVH